MPKYGVRIYPLDNQVILIKQTVKRDSSGVYVVDTMEDGEHREAHVPVDDDAAIASAVRDALHGLLLRS